jgi:D-3-phosphoglycerate dehydrogenase
VVVTDLRRAGSVPAAEQAMAVLLPRSRRACEGVLKDPVELHGKTVLVIGLAGTGDQDRATAAFGMRVRVIDPKDRTARLRLQPGPARQTPGVARGGGRGGAGGLVERQTRGLIGPEQVRAMKKTASLVNVGRPELIQTEAVEEALRTANPRGRAHPDSVAAARPRPAVERRESTPLGREAGSGSPEAVERRWRLLRENVPLRRGGTSALRGDQLTFVSPKRWRGAASLALLR